MHLGVKRSRVPVLAGISHSTLDGAVELASEAFGSGAAGLLLMPPYFFRYGQDDILEFYTRFREQVPKRLPVLLYNIPQFSNGIAIETAARLLQTGLYSGIKDSGGDGIDMNAEVGSFARETFRKTNHFGFRCRVMHGSRERTNRAD